jgi:hypothetical protein
MSTRKDHHLVVDTIHGKHFFGKPLSVSRNLKEKLLNMIYSNQREEDRVSNKNRITIEEEIRGNRDSTIVGGKDPQRSLLTYYGTIFRSITSIIIKSHFRLINIPLQSYIWRH